MPCLDRKAEYQRSKEKIKRRVREWVAANPDRVREYAREYAKRPAQRDKHNDYRRRWNARNKERALWTAAKKRAERFGLDFNIEIEDVVIPDRCPLLGIRIVRDNTITGRRNSPSLDRKDTTRGYVKGNVWVISWQANTMKSAAEIEELVSFARGVLQHFG